jgi:hypothetical protein
MGLFYTNIILYKVQRENIIDFLNWENRVSYLSPTISDCTVIYDQGTEDQDTDVLRELTEKVTRKLKCRGLASLVHDSDLYLYWLYDNGKLIDTYNSLPGYFDDEEQPIPKGGNAKKLCSAFDKTESLLEVRDIFERVKEGNLSEDWSEEFIQGEDIHGALVKALGLAPFGAYIGYYTIDNKVLSEGFDIKDFIKLPDR